ncbi:MAG: hypothetical protein JNK10_12740 [Cyclobacteriaceae bacterium]|nr:hypothetical protein [Cyclobacteriaceae bacterium]
MISSLTSAIIRLKAKGIRLLSTLPMLMQLTTSRISYSKPVEEIGKELRVTAPEFSLVTVSLVLYHGLDI